MQNFDELSQARQDLAAAIQETFAQKVWHRPRLLRQDGGKRYEIKMHNDYLTPQGKAYKKQKLTGQYVRSLLEVRAGIVAPVEYTWEQVHFATGENEAHMKSTNWTFAQGVSFQSSLLAASAYDVNRHYQEAESPKPESKGSVRIDVSYASLPKTPSVNLLRMFSWDIITFEVIASQISSMPELNQCVGVSLELDALSNSGASLAFPEYALSSFKNGKIFAVFLGYSVVQNIPCAIYEYHCEGSELDVQAEVNAKNLRQQGSSHYSGKLFIAIENGDLIAGTMQERIIATLQQHNKTLPVQKQRYVTVNLLPDDQVESEAASDTDVQAAQSTTISPSLELRDACQTALKYNRYLKDFIKGNIAGYESLEESLTAMAHTGFQSITGSSLADWLETCDDLAESLEAIKEEIDYQAAPAFQENFPKLRGMLHRLIVYTEVLPDEAAPFYQDDLETFQRVVESLAEQKQNISILIKTLTFINTQLNQLLPKVMQQP